MKVATSQTILSIITAYENSSEKIAVVASSDGPSTVHAALPHPPECFSQPSTASGLPSDLQSMCATATTAFAPDAGKGIWKSLHKKETYPA